MSLETTIIILSVSVVILGFISLFKKGININIQFPTNTYYGKDDDEEDE